MLYRGPIWFNKKGLDGLIASATTRRGGQRGRTELVNDESHRVRIEITGTALRDHQTVHRSGEDQYSQRGAQCHALGLAILVRIPRGLRFSKYGSLVSPTDL